MGIKDILFKCRVMFKLVFGMKYNECKIDIEVINEKV